MMTKLLVAVAAAALLAVSVGPTMAGNTKTDQVTKAPVQLTAAQMDQVVAGRTYRNSGAIPDGTSVYIYTLQTKFGDENKYSTSDHGDSWGQASYKYSSSLEPCLWGTACPGSF